MLQDRICKECGRSFQGGPRAYYCPACRAERTKRTNAEYRRRKRVGDVRLIGSTDICERCEKTMSSKVGCRGFVPLAGPTTMRSMTARLAWSFTTQTKGISIPHETSVDESVLRRASGVEGCLTRIAQRPNIAAATAIETMSTRSGDGDTTRGGRKLMPPTVRPRALLCSSVSSRNGHRCKASVSATQIR